MAYTTITDLAADTTYTAGTYYMDANHNANSKKLTLDCNAGDIIIKRNGDVYWTSAGELQTTNSGTYKVYFTVKDDDTVGDTISGSTGSPAVSGGSWNNAVIITGYVVAFINWEIRWATNVAFIIHNGNYNTIFYNITFKNCAYSIATANSYVIDLRYQRGVQGTNYHDILFDNTNTLTSSTGLLKYSTRDAVYNITVAAANTTCTTGIIYENIFWNSTTYNSVISSCIKILNAGTGYGFVGGNRNHAFGTIDFRFCYCSIVIAKDDSSHEQNTIIQDCLFDANIISTSSYPITLSIGSISVVRLKNCVFNGTAKAIYSVCYRTEIFNCIFKSITSYVFGTSSKVTACRNNIFDSNTAISQGALTTPCGIKNNGYYNNTSETNWTRGPYDTTISAPSWGNFPNGTLHADWLTYGPGDGWYTTQDIATGADTNSFVGIGTTNQSHTGTTETAVTQRLGLAPVFSVLV